MRRLLVLLVVALAGASLPAAALPLPGAAAPPPGAISDNVEYVTTLTEPATAIAVNFIGATMFVSTLTGIFSYDVTDPSAPELLGVLPLHIYQNEDMTVDAERRLLFIARDPRGITGIATPEQGRLVGQLEIVDVSDPALMVPVGALPLPAGHTATCIPDGTHACGHVWVGGPYANTALGEPRGRPIYGVDVRDPAQPVRCPGRINEALRADGDTGYAHDVNVDAAGIAWVASDGGVHGYHTSGEHRDPRSGEPRTATPCAPVPYAGGVAPGGPRGTRFMHNSERPLTAAIPGAEDSIGQVLYATEEELGSVCATTGRFATYDLRPSLDGSGFTDSAGFALTELDTWHPEGQEGATGCASAHYFDDRGDGLLAYGFYGQGTRFLDVSDPRDIRQVGYFRPDGASTWAATWYGEDHVFVADNGRGVDILRFRDAEDPAAMREVAAPALPAAASRPPATAWRPDPRTGGICLLRR